MYIQALKREVEQVLEPCLSDLVLDENDNNQVLSSMLQD